MRIQCCATSKCEQNNKVVGNVVSIDANGGIVTLNKLKFDNKNITLNDTTDTYQANLKDCVDYTEVLKKSAKFHFEYYILNKIKLMLIQARSDFTKLDDNKYFDVVFNNLRYTILTKIKHNTNDDNDYTPALYNLLDTYQLLSVDATFDSFIDSKKEFDTLRNIITTEVNNKIKELAEVEEKQKLREESKYINKFLSFTGYRKK